MFTFLPRRKANRGDIQADGLVHHVRAWNLSCTHYPGSLWRSSLIHAASFVARCRKRPLNFGFLTEIWIICEVNWRASKARSLILTNSNKERLHAKHAAAPQNSGFISAFAWRKRETRKSAPIWPVAAFSAHTLSSTQQSTLHRCCQTRSTLLITVH